jgi:hypothetical protein
MATGLGPTGRARTEPAGRTGEMGYGVSTWAAVTWGSDHTQSRGQQEPLWDRVGVG